MYGSRTPTCHVLRCRPHSPRPRTQGPSPLRGPSCHAAQTSPHLPPDSRWFLPPFGPRWLLGKKVARWLRLFWASGFYVVAGNELIGVVTFTHRRLQVSLSKKFVLALRKTHCIVSIFATKSAFSSLSVVTLSELYLPCVLILFISCSFIFICFSFLPEFRVCVRVCVFGGLTFFLLGENPLRFQAEHRLRCDFFFFPEND